MTTATLTKTAADLDPVVVDAPAGRVVGVAAVTAIEDLHGEVITPMAFANTLAFRSRPIRLLVDHDVSTWGMASIDLAEELLPSDPRLPPQIRALGAGALIFGAQFDMANELAAQTFRRVALDAASGNGSWSVGYRVLADHWVGKVRHLDEIELLEISAVAWGANPHTLTLQTKGLRSRRGTAEDALVLAGEAVAFRRREQAVAALLSLSRL